jgi:hypothetical protein
MTQPSTLQAAREQAIDTLCRRFADDTLSMQELERRLEQARSARTREQLRALLSDLAPLAPVRSPDPGAPEAGPSRLPDRHARQERTREGEVRMSSSVALAVLGGTRRAGKWSPPQNMLAFAVMGGVELDFRDAVLTPGSTTTINCFAFWGGIDITVPPDVYVDTRGFALMGGFEQTGDVWEEPPEGAPRIEVNGFALMGGVDVKVRGRGEGRAGTPRARRHLSRGEDEV